MSILNRIIGRKLSTKREEKAEKAEKKETLKLKSERKETKAKKSWKNLVEKKEKSVKATKSEKEAKVQSVAKKDENIAYKILFENIISEKSTLLGAENKYVFRVHPKASKFQIKEAVEGYYGVRVTSVNTIKIHPKKRTLGRTVGWKKGFKKAIVTLQEGDTITAVEGV